MKNLLLISFEDLNDWVEPLGGHPQAWTPSLSRLASIGTTFRSAYAAAPACSPSRNAMLFSRFPWETGLIANSANWHGYYPAGRNKSLVGKLRQAGMETIGAGKIFHSNGGTEFFPKQETIDPSDWSDYHFERKVDYPTLSASVRSGSLGKGADFGVDPTGEPSLDDKITQWMIDRIEPGASGKAWMLGLVRPHLPFIAPKEFFDRIPTPVSLPPGLGANHFDPDDDRSHSNLSRPAKGLAKAYAKMGPTLNHHGEYDAFLRAYLAAIAYADSKLGLLLDRLEQCGLMDDTLIVFWSDHGWQLGEKLAFRKFTLWERALRVPVIFAGAGIEKQAVTAPISLVDLAPTILSLLGIEPTPDFSGQDLSPALFGSGSLARPYAPSLWGIHLKGDAPKVAFSIRTEQHRYIRYWNGAEELYDHTRDPFEHENLIALKDAEETLSTVEQFEKYIGETLTRHPFVPSELSAAEVVEDEQQNDDD